VSSEQAIPWRREPPVFNLSILRLQRPITPVSSLHGCDESRQTPIRIKRAAMLLPIALAALPPQKNVGAAAASNGFVTAQWLPEDLAPIPGWLALRAIRSTANR